MNMKMKIIWWNLWETEWKINKITENKTLIFKKNYPTMRLRDIKIQKDKWDFIDSIKMKIKISTIMRVTSSKKTTNREDKVKIFTDNKINKIKSIHAMTLSST